ncbi:MAG: hypothetical protein IBX39_05995 [Candidatus Methanoperedenaceae archaeon]|nr:hypothetical protein [Candidatus Methanoperedenaceae archaeon]
MVGIKRLFKKKSNELEDKQKANTLSINKNLNSARTIIDRLIQTTNEVRDARALRSRLTGLISDVQRTGFGRKGASLDDFYAGEELLVKCTDNLINSLEQSGDSLDAATIKGLMDVVEDAINNRVSVTEELKDLFFEEIKEKQLLTAKQEVPDTVSSELTLYLNVLHTKYASSEPDVLHTGDYFPFLKWEYRTGNKSISAQLSDGLIGIPLMLEARWQDNSASIAAMVQKEAEGVRRNGFKCLCLVCDVWDDKNRSFAERFNHPKLTLYLYELNGELVFNSGNPTASHYEFWFNNEQVRETLKECAIGIIESQEYFTPQDIAGALGMNVDGAGRLLVELENEGVVVDVSFKSDKVRKYTKAKGED